MPEIIAKIEITVTDDGAVAVIGVGDYLKNKAHMYGVLEVAKDLARGQPGPRVEAAAPGDLARFTKPS